MRSVTYLPSRALLAIVVFFCLLALLALSQPLSAQQHDPQSSRGRATDPSKMRPSSSTEDLRKLLSEPRKAVQQFGLVLRKSTSEIRQLSRSYKKNRNRENRQRVLSELVGILANLKSEADAIVGPGGRTQREFKARLERLDKKLDREKIKNIRRLQAMRDEIARIESILREERTATARLVSKMPRENRNSSSLRRKLFQSYSKEQELNDRLMTFKMRVAQGEEEADLTGLKEGALTKSEVAVFHLLRPVRRLSLRLDLAADRLESVIQWQAYQDIAGGLDDMVLSGAALEESSSSMADELGAVLDLLRPDKSRTRVQISSFTSDFDTWLERLRQETQAAQDPVELTIRGSKKGGARK